MNRRERRRVLKQGKHLVMIKTIGRVDQFSAHASLLVTGKIDEDPRSVYTGNMIGAPYLVKEAMLFLRRNAHEEWRQIVIEQAALLKADGFEAEHPWAAAIIDDAAGG